MLPSDFGQTVANGFSQFPEQKAMEVSTAGMSGQDVKDVVDAIFTACANAGVKLKGIVVDAAQLPLPQKAEFGNAYFQGGNLVVVDFNLNDMLIVRRA